MRLPPSYLLAAISLIVFPQADSSAQANDGRLFDPGVAMSAPAEGAPDELSGMLYVLGQWDFEYRAFRSDTLFRNGAGLAHITLMNRGHAIMERSYCDGCSGDGRDIPTISFLAFNTAAGVWNRGLVDGHAESISVSSGSLVGEVLLLHNAVRHLGGATLTNYRTTYRQEGASSFNVTVETSTDYQATWDTTIVRNYTHRQPEEGFLAGGSEYGRPSETRSDDADGFDFLIGSFDAPQELTFPNGRTVNFPSTTTAVYALDGNAILEYGWYDTDPNLPDAATSIVRIYNRAMRRWESLYMANRGNGALFFGGHDEGDRIVLGLFETDLDLGPMVRFVFHDIRDDGYSWYSESSADLGKTWAKTWIIDVTRQPDSATSGD